MKVQFMKRKSINEKLQLRPPALAIIAFNRPEKLEQLLASLKKTLSLFLFNGCKNININELIKRKYFNDIEKLSDHSIYFK